MYNSYKLLLRFNKRLRDVLVILLAFTAGVVTAEAFYTPSDNTHNLDSVVIQYDYSRLLPDTCKTNEECYIAGAITYYQNDPPLDAIPILDPNDCSDLMGRARQQCEQDNFYNAGKPALYPTALTSDIFN